MGKHKFALLVGLVILIAMGGVVLLRGLGSNNFTDEAIAAGIPDTEEAREIQATIVEAYKLYYIAGQTYDVSQFPSVLANDPDVPLTRDQRERLRDWFGTVPNDAGYLTYVTACYTNAERWDRISEEAWGKAMAAGRDHLLPEDYLTPEELREIQEANRPIPPPPGRRSPSSMSAEEYAEWKWQNTRFDSVVINGDRAIVIFDDHLDLNEATLVRHAGKWYLAGVERVGASRW